MKIVGIDPGLQGCAFLTDSTRMIFSGFKFDFNEDKIFDSQSFECFLKKTKPDFILIENIHGRGGWGAHHNFSFGMVFGQILASFYSQFAFEKVMPISWQAIIHKGVEKIPKEKIKDRTLRAYNQKFPEDPLRASFQNKKGKAINNNAIDAFLISIYGQIVYADLKNYNFKEEIL